MKRIVLVVFSIIAITATTYAQQRGGDRGSAQGGGRAQGFDPQELIDNQINKAVKKLKLDETQEPNFKMLYNEYLAQKLQLLQKERQSSMLEQQGETTVANVEQKIDLRTASVQLDKTFFADFKKFLTDKQLIVLYEQYMIAGLKMPSAPQGGRSQGGRGGR